MFYFQDPTLASSPFLLDTIIQECDGAESFTGVFAFASAAGVRLLTASTPILRLMEQGSVRLCVGLDAVTDTAALDALRDAEESGPNLRVEAFLNPRPNAIFHPKFCWIKRPGGGLRMTGSCNLTERGLLGNWEAYAAEELDDETLSQFDEQWENWRERQGEWLRPLDDETVRERAAQNTVLALEGDLPTLHARPRASSGECGTLGRSGAVEILLAEIPRSGRRWKQANFRKQDYESFFGADVTRPQLFVFRKVRSDGGLEDYTQDRPSVAVKSQNYRFELDVPAGTAYPTGGRPIGVFARVATRAFYYQLLMPGFAGYDELLATLREAVGDIDVRRMTLTAEELHERWPDGALWEALSSWDGAAA